MPGTDGKLTEEEKAKIRDWFSKRTKEHVCPVCRTSNWIIGDHLVQPITLLGNTLQIGGGIGYPQVMLVSTDCGHTQLFNAVILGISPPAPPKEGG